MTQTLSLGPLSLLAEQHGPLLTITIHAPSDSAPVGKMTLTVPEWTSLVAMVDCMGAAEKRHAEDAAEIKAMRESLIHACSLINDRYDNAREIWAIRQTANLLSERFSHERVQNKYEEYCRDEQDVRAENDSLRQQVRELTEERDAYRRAKQENDERFMTERDQARSDLSAALVSVDAMAERIEQMRPVYEAAVEWHRVRAPGMQQHDKFVSTEDALWDAIDTALAHPATNACSTTPRKTEASDEAM